MGIPRIHAFRTLLAALLLAALPGAAPPPSGPPPSGDGRVLMVHYARLDESYDRWNLWAWPEGGAGAAFPFEGRDSFGRFALVPLDAWPGAKRVGIVVRKGEWEAKDFDGDRFIDVGTRPVTEAWIVSGDSAVHAERPSVDRTLRVTGAFLDARDRITLATSVPIGEARARQARISVDRVPAAIRVESANELAPAPSGASITELRLSRPVRDDEIARLRLDLADPLPGAGAPVERGSGPAIVVARGVLEDPAFAATDARLGARCTAFRTEFRTWSPVSESVDLLLFDEPSAGKPSRTVPMRAERGGTWAATVTGDLHGKAYLYRFRHYGNERTVPDIHCFAATSDSGRSVVADMDRLRPAGWEGTPAPRIAQPTDEVLYEIHVRDFSVADESCPAAVRGTYLGLVHEGTAPDGSPRGLAYLRRLGITAVHLMPVHDFTAAPDAYNWGYWTALFNVPESNYAAHRPDPMAPILELRTAIQGLHAAGIRVILDVAYNHTSSSRESSPFDGTVPYWFFRTAPDGTYLNDAGCGNSVADERATVRAYVLASLEFWLTQYRVDGFRFDLLGTHSPETVRAACALAKRLRPDATLYGEPWTGGGPVRFGKGAQRGLPIAVFNDDIRTAVRGDTDGSAPGFATGPGGDLAGVRRGVAGSIDDFAQEPGESVNYVSAHDNLTLVDKIARAAPEADAGTRRAMQKLALGIVLVSQGIPFLEGGSELCRTKQGDHNSYEAGDAVNRFDWAAAMRCQDVSEWTAGMIAIRRAHPGLRMDDDAEVRAALAFTEAAPLVAWTIDGAASGDPARRLLVALNGDPAARKLALPAGAWRILADAERAGTVPIRTASGTVELPPYSMVVAEQ